MISTFPSDATARMRTSRVFRFRTVWSCARMRTDSRGTHDPTASRAATKRRLLRRSLYFHVAAHVYLPSAAPETVSGARDIHAEPTRMNLLHAEAAVRTSREFRIAADAEVCTRRSSIVIARRNAQNTVQCMRTRPLPSASRAFTFAMAWTFNDLQRCVHSLAFFDEKLDLNSWIGRC